MIDQIGRTVCVGDQIVWATCRMTKFRKHHTNLLRGIVIHIDTKAMATGHIAETILVERDMVISGRRSSVLLIDPIFVVVNEVLVESNSS